MVATSRIAFQSCSKKMVQMDDAASCAGLESYATSRIAFQSCSKKIVQVNVVIFCAGLESYATLVLGG